MANFEAGSEQGRKAEVVSFEDIVAAAGGLTGGEILRAVSGSEDDDIFNSVLARQAEVPGQNLEAA